MSNDPASFNSGVYARDSIISSIGKSATEDSLVKIASLIPEGSVVLDVGCSDGTLGTYLTEFKDCQVDGIDIDPDAIEVVAKTYRSAMIFDLNAQPLSDAFQNASYDFVIFADVLEHLLDPKAPLSDAAKLLRPKGKILISIPNVGYVGLLLELLHGNFTYRDKGILDRTHLHFFTRVELLHLIRDAGLVGSIVERVALPIQDSEFRTYVLADLAEEELATLSNAHDAGIYQFIAAATPIQSLDERLLTETPEIPLATPPALSFRVAVYWQSNNDGFTEDLSTSYVVPIDGHFHDLTLTISGENITALRFDPSDIEGVVELELLQIISQANDVLWNFSDTIDTADLNEFSDIEGPIVNDVTKVVTIFCTGRDSWIILPLDHALLSSAGKIFTKIRWMPLTAFRETEPSDTGRPNDAGFGTRYPFVTTLERKNDRVSFQPGRPKYPSRTTQLQTVERTETTALVLAKEVHRLSTELCRAEGELQHTKSRITDLLNSDSWKMTTPVRYMSKITKQVLARSLTNQKLPNTVRESLLKVPPISRIVSYHAVNKPRPNQHDFVLPVNQGYKEWLKLHAEITPTSRTVIRKAINSWKAHPEISILMPVYRSNLEYLAQAIESIQRQYYPHWQLCICDDGSDSPELSSFLKQLASRDRRIQVATHDKTTGIASATNTASTLATGTFIAFLDHDDELAPEALFYVVSEILRNPNGIVFYSDEDKIDTHNNHYCAYFKPDFSPRLLLAQNYMNHLTVVRSEVFREFNGLSSDFDGSQDWDFLLRVTEGLDASSVVHIPWVLYHWRAVAGSTAQESSAKPQALDAGRRAVESAISRRKIDMNVEFLRPTGYLIQHAPLSNYGKVSIIIPTKDKIDLLKACIDSIRTTEYPNYEIIVVDNFSTEIQSHEYFEELTQNGVRVLPYNHPFNYSALHNFVVQQLDSQFLCLMNNDVEVIHPNWLTEMVGVAQEPSVGAVGALLLYEDGTIQHAGVQLGIGGVAGHLFKGMRPEASPFGLALLTREVSAVTAACMVVRKNVWDQVGGMDESLTVAFNDVDFCLAAREAGFTNVFVPRAKLYHFESKSRGSDFTPARLHNFADENAYMKWKWGQMLTCDPFYNPNLSLATENFEVSPRSRAQVPWEPRSKILSAAAGIATDIADVIIIMPGTAIENKFLLPLNTTELILRIGIALARPIASIPEKIYGSISDGIGASSRIQKDRVEQDDLGIHRIWFKLETPFKVGINYTQLRLRLHVPKNQIRLDLQALISSAWSGNIGDWPQRSLDVQIECAFG